MPNLKHLPLAAVLALLTTAGGPAGSHGTTRPTAAGSASTAETHTEAARPHRPGWGRLPDELRGDDLVAQERNERLRTRPAGIPCGPSGLFLAAELDRTVLREAGEAPLVLVIQGSRAPVPIHVWNATPGVVHLAGGDDRTLLTSGGSPNTATLNLQVQRGGDFEIRYEAAGVRCSSDSPRTP